MEVSNENQQPEAEAPQPKPRAWFPGVGVDPGTENFASFVCAYTFEDDGTCVIAINQDRTECFNLLMPLMGDVTPEKYRDVSNEEYLHRCFATYFKKFPGKLLPWTTFVNEKQWFNPGPAATVSNKLMIVQRVLDSWQRRYSSMVFNTHPATWKAHLDIKKTAKESRTVGKQKALDKCKEIIGEQIYNIVIDGNDHKAEALLVFFDHIKTRQADRNARNGTKKKSRSAKDVSSSSQVHFTVIREKQWRDLLAPLIAVSPPEQS